MFIGATVDAISSPLKHLLHVFCSRREKLLSINPIRCKFTNHERYTSHVSFLTLIAVIYVVKAAALCFHAASCESQIIIHVCLSHVHRGDWFTRLHCNESAWLFSSSAISLFAAIRGPNHAIIVCTGRASSIINTALITVSSLIFIRGFVISETRIKPCLSWWDVRQKICYRAYCLLTVACWLKANTPTLTRMIQWAQ